MAMSLDQQHAAYGLQQRTNMASIGVDFQRAAYDQQKASSPEFGRLQRGSESGILD